MQIQRFETERASSEATERRTRLGLYLDILRVIASGTTKPTRILFEARLSWTSMKKALEFLLENELIVKEEIDNEDTRRGATRDLRLKEKYLITNKGLIVIKFFEKEQILANLLAQ